MRNVMISIVTMGLLALGACSTDEDVKEDVDTGESCADDSGDVIDTGDTADTADTGETGETGDTADTAVDPVDTGDTATDPVDTGSDTGADDTGSDTATPE